MEKIRISEGKSKFTCILPSESIFGEAKVRISEGKSKFTCILPSESIFGKAKVRISREKMQASLHFFRGRVSSAEPKIMKVRGFRRFRFGLLTVFSVAVSNSGRRVPYIVKHGPDGTYRSISRSTRIRRDEMHP